MGQEVAQSDGAPRWTGTGLAVVVEAFQHRDFIQVGDDACGRSVQVEASPLDELHGRGSGHGLGHGGDPADGVRGHCAAAQHAFAEAAQVKIVSGTGDAGHHPRHRTFGRRFTQDRIDSLGEGHRFASVRKHTRRDGVTGWIGNSGEPRWGRRPSMGERCNQDRPFWKTTA